MTAELAFLTGMVKESAEAIEFSEALELMSYEDLADILEKTAAPFPGPAVKAIGESAMRWGAKKGNLGKMMVGGGAAGGVTGAMNAGTNPQTGQPNSMIGGAIKGMAGGAMLGAAGHVGARAGLSAMRAAPGQAANAAWNTTKSTAGSLANRAMGGIDQAAAKLQGK